MREGPFFTSVVLLGDREGEIKNREIETKILDVDEHSLRDRLCAEGARSEPSVALDTIWFDTTALNTDGRKVSARVRTTRLSDGSKTFSWAVKIKYPQDGPFSDRPEYEEDAPSPGAAKRALREYLERTLSLTAPPQLVKEMDLTKTRASYRLTGKYEGIRFDFDVLTEVNGRHITPPIQILEIECIVATEGLSFGEIEAAKVEAQERIRACAAHFGLTIDEMRSGFSTRAILRERGYLP